MREPIRDIERLRHILTAKDFPILCPKIVQFISELDK